VDLSGGSAPPASAGFGGGGGAAPGGGGGFSNALGEQVAAAALNDPHVQSQIKQTAMHHASQGFAVAKEGAATAYSELHSYIQEGPAGVSVLCFLGGLATTIVGFLGLLSVFSVVLSPFQYVLNVYLTGFGVISVLLEADVERIKDRRIIGRLAPWCQYYQQQVFEKAKFLTELRGRGLFYVFVGTLAVTQCFLCLLFVVGMWNLTMGVFCLAMSLGINPTEHLLPPQAGAAQAPGGGALLQDARGPGHP